MIQVAQSEINYVQQRIGEGIVRVQGNSLLQRVPGPFKPCGRVSISPAPPGLGVVDVPKAIVGPCELGVQLNGLLEQNFSLGDIVLFDLIMEFLALDIIVIGSEVRGGLASDTRRVRRSQGAGYSAQCPGDLL